MADTTLIAHGRFDDGISPALKQIESGIIRVVGAFSALSTAVTTIAAPIILAAEYQKQLLEVQKTTDYTAKATAYLGRELVELSKTINVSANDLAKIAALGGQLGVGDAGAKALVSFTEEIARAVTALDVDAELAATSLGKLINIFNIDPSKYRNVISVINQLSNVSTARPEELFDILRRIGNLGGSVSVDQATALSAVMIDLGLTAETAGTSLTKVFADMKASAGDFANFVGLSTEQWSSLVEKDGIGALKLYLTTLNKMPPAIAAATKAQLTGEGRIFGLITKLQEEMGRGGGLLDRRLTEAQKEYGLGTSALKEQQNVLSGLSAQWEVLKNKVRALFIAAGEETLSPLTQTIRKLGDVLADQRTIDAFVVSAKAVVTAMQQVGSAISTVVGHVSSLGLNWVRIFDIAAMLLALKGIQMLAQGAAMLRGAFSFGPKLGAEASAGAARTASAWSSVTGTILKLGGAYEAAAYASRVAAAQQVADTARVAAAQTEMRARQSSATMAQQASSYYGRWVQPLVTKTLANTVTAQEAQQLQVRLANYTRMVDAANSLSSARVLNEVEAQRIMTSVNNAEVRKRLAAYIASLNKEKQARALLSAEQSAQSSAAGAGFAPIFSDVGPLQKFSAALRDITSYGLGAYLATAAGNAQRYALATTVAGRATVVLASALTMVGRAVGFVASRLLGWVSFLFIAGEIIVSIAEMTGVLDKLKGAVWAVLKLFGVKTKPAFLDSKNAEADRLATQREYERLIAEKQQFEQQFGAIAIPMKPTVEADIEFESGLAKVVGSVEKARAALSNRLTFKIDNPQDASKAATEMVEATNRITAGLDGLRAEAEKSTTDFSNVSVALSNATAEYDRIAKAKGVDSAAAKTQKAAVDDLQKQYESLSAIADRRMAASSAMAVQLSRQMDETLSFFTEEAAVDVFTKPTDSGRSLIETLQNLRKAQQAVADQAKQIGVTDVSVVPSNTEGFTKEQLADLEKLREAYRTYGEQATQTKTKLMGLDSLRKLFTNDQAKANFLDKLAASADAFGDKVRSLTADAGALKKVTTGAGEVKVPVGTTVDQIAAQIAIALEAKKAYTEMAKIAEARANDAKNAVNRAIDANRQAYKEFTEFLVRTKRNLEAQLDKASSQVKSRAIDDGTATRQDGLSAAKQLENDILNMIKEEGYVNKADLAERLAGLEQAKMYGQQQLTQLLTSGKISKETYDREMAALDSSVMMQKDILDYYYQRGNMTSAEASAIQQVLNLKYKASERKIVDDAEAQKSQLNLDNISTAFGRLEKSAAASSQRLKAIDAELSKDTVASESKVALLEERSRIQAELASTMGQLRSETEKFSSVDPVAGKVIVDPAQVAAMQEAVRKYTEMQASLNVSSAGKEEAVWESYKVKLSGAAAAMQTLVVSGNDAFKAIGDTKNSLESLVAAASRLPEVSTAIAGFKDALAKSATGQATVVKTEDIVKSISAASSQITSEMLSGLPPVRIKAMADEAGLVETRAQLVAAIGSAAKDAEAAINAAGGISLKATLNVDKTLNVPGQSAAIPQNNRDGGFIQAFAGGGDVRGAGTGRSDSILSWLSHGEYVMDATTVRMFGGGFFRTLQDLAKRGANLEGLRSRMMSFADGGGFGIPGLPSLAGVGLQSISNTPGDTMNLDISLNGVKRSRLRGSRESVNEFVEAVRELQKGIAK